MEVVPRKRRKKERGEAETIKPHGTKAPPKNTRWNHDAFPPNVRSDNTARYYWSHGHDKSHNSGECKGKLMGHQDSARSHLGTGGNPAYAERTVFLAKMGLIGLSKYRTTRNGAPPALPTWNQQANMGM